MVQLDDRGVSDVVVIAFMFILLVMSVTLLFGFNTNPLRAAGNRQMELKTNFLHRTLEKSEVRPDIPALAAAAEQVAGAPRVEENYLRDWMTDTLEFLRPAGHGVEVILRENNYSWRVSYPEDASYEGGVSSEGSVTITKAGGEVVSVNVEIWVFEINE